MPTLNPSQSYENILLPVKGFVPSYALDYSAQPDADADFEAGTLVSLNSAGEFVAGLATDTDYVAMPMFAINGTSDFDAQGDEGNIEGGGITGMVATGGFEVYTSAYDTNGTYNPNTFLTAATGDDAGKVTPASTDYSGDTIVGIVSQGEKNGVSGGAQYPEQDLLYFWTHFIPAHSDVSTT